MQRKAGRVHTSTVTVAVLGEPTELEVKILEKDLEWTACRGSGPGGQNRNKVNSAVQLKHVPTQIHIRCESERSQWQNRQTALAMLRAKIWEMEDARINGSRDEDRKSQLGSGMRGSKTWTVRVQDETVTHHESGRKIRLSDYLKGKYLVR